MKISPIMLSRMSAMDRLYHHAIKSVGGCWGWTGSRSAKGYGFMRIGGVTMGAHRASWIVHNGTIPAGKHVLHRCDNPECTNPLHLFLGTNTDNVRDCVAKGRYKNRAMKATHCRRGHPYSGSNLYVAVRPDGRKSRECRACRKAVTEAMIAHEDAERAEGVSRGK